QSSAAENGGGFKNEDAADAQQAGRDDDEEHQHAHADGVLPEQHDAARGDLLGGDLEEQRAESRAQRITDETDSQRLEDNHRDKPAVRDPDGFEDAELFQVLDGEQVEGLTRNHESHQERNGDRDAEVH